MATTINNYAVSLSLEASNYVRNSILSRKETFALKREIEGARTPAENYARSLNRLDLAYKVGAVDQATYSRLVSAAAQKYGQAATTTSLYARAMNTLGISTKDSSSAIDVMTLSLKRFAAAYVAYKAYQGAKASISLASEVEDASIAFKVLTGDIRTSQRMLTDLRDLAAKSPLTVSSAQQAAKTMLLFGVSTQEILPTLRMLGEITGGNAQRFEMLTLAFSQMSAAGRMMGQDLLQMVNAGFNPLQEISRKTGESMIELKKRMEDGRISSKEIADAFRSATSQGGRFFGMMDEQSKTFSGSFSIMSSEIKMMATEIGDGLLPVMKDLVSVVRSLNSAMKMLDVGQRFKTGVGAIRAMGADLVDGLSNLSRSGQPFRADNLNQFRNDTFNPKLMSKPDANYTPPWFDPAKSSATDYTMSHAIESALQTGIESLKTGTGGMMDAIRAFQEGSSMIAMSGIANTQELTKALKDDPAVRNLQVGTQEAYEYLTQASRDLERQTRLEAVRKQQLDENAKAQREKMTEWLSRINTALENNGFKRIR